MHWQSKRAAHSHHLGLPTGVIMSVLNGSNLSTRKQSSAEMIAQNGEKPAQVEHCGKQNKTGR